MNPLIQLKVAKLSVVIISELAWLAALPLAQALAPPPDGGYAGANTAEGNGALNSITPQGRGSGSNNTAVGYTRCLPTLLGASTRPRVPSRSQTTTPTTTRPMVIKRSPATRLASRTQLTVLKRC
jgi:hypothetical protein